MLQEMLDTFLWLSQANYISLSILWTLWILIVKSVHITKCALVKHSSLLTQCAASANALHINVFATPNQLIKTIPGTINFFVHVMNSSHSQDSTNICIPT